MTAVMVTGDGPGNANGRSIFAYINICMPRVDCEELGLD